MGNPVAGPGRDRENAFHGGRGRDGSLARFRQKDAEDSREGVVHGSDAVKAISGGRLMKNKHAGSGFDDFLQEEGLLAETEAVALKRVLAFQLEKEMEERKLSKFAFARQMKTSRSSLDRLLDPDNPSVTLLTLEKAAAVLGLQLKVEFA